MKKYLLSGLVIVAFVGYVLFQRNSSKTSNLPVTPPVTSTTSEVTATDNGASGNPPATNPTPNPTSTPVTKPKGLYTDGVYTGPVTDAIFGNLQVKVTISGGKISDVALVQYPNANGNSIRINQDALPVLKQEAIAAQSAKVNVVSGATQSSEAFQQSLSAALTQAKS